MAENNGQTAKRKCGGRPFPAGMSGNPGGRPKVIAEVRDLARQHTRKAIGTLVKVMQSGESDSARVAAANALLDRGFGRPRTDQPVTLDEMDGALADRGRAVLSAMASGRLTPSEAATLMQALAAQGRIVEVEDLAQRVGALEEAMQRRTRR
jgi:DNA-binding response OmpR family regulator